jgi:HPt (histidine-containing phosphotransfer) domain-containing protein
MADKRSPTTFRESSNSVRHSLDGAWTQVDLGKAFDVSTLSVIGELDPTGADGVVREVLALFRDSLEPTLAAIEASTRSPERSRQLIFAAHKLKGASGQIGALRLAAACEAIEKHLATRLTLSADMDGVLRALVDTQIAEIIRVQRRLRILLA